MTGKIIKKDSRTDSDTHLGGLAICIMTLIPAIIVNVVCRIFGKEPIFH